MRRRIALLAFLPTVLTIGACGSSSHSSSTASGGAKTQTSATTSLASTGTTQTSASTKKPPKSAKHPIVAVNARIPVTFAIRAGGVEPPQISVPSGLAIQLTVISKDGRTHHVVLKTPTPRALAVPAGGRATVLIKGVRAGQYPLEVDGANRAELITGAQPGP